MGLTCFRRALPYYAYLWGVETDCLSELGNEHVPERFSEIALQEGQG